MGVEEEDDDDEEEEEIDLASQARKFKCDSLLEYRETRYLNTNGSLAQQI